MLEIETASAKHSGKAIIERGKGEGEHVGEASEEVPPREGDAIRAAKGARLGAGLAGVGVGGVNVAHERGSVAG